MLVTAQGLLVYFQRDEVHELIAAIAGRLRGSSFVFDVVPEKMAAVVRSQPGRERDQAARLWSWLFSPQERTGRHLQVRVSSAASAPWRAVCASIASRSRTRKLSMACWRGTRGQPVSDSNVANTVGPVSWLHWPF